MCWLDKRVIGFKQDVRSFLTSKTNITAITAIAGAATACYLNQINAVEAFQIAVPAVIGLFLKDASVAQS